MLSSGDASKPVVAYALDPVTLGASSLLAQCFDDSSPVELAASETAEEFALWHFAPALGESGWALLGQVTRHWVPVWGRATGFAGKGVGAGVIGVNASDGSAVVIFGGSPGENITLTFAALGAAASCTGGMALKTVGLSCVVGSSGVVHFVLPEMACSR